MTEEELIIAAKKMGIELDKNKMQQLEMFYNFLIKKNEVMNLTGITNKEEVYLKHFYDSLTLVKAMDFNNINSVCDVGSGAGFPGIVLKIVYPHLHIVLLDAREKRIKYLNELIEYLSLNNITAIHTRSEEYKDEFFDCVTARAVAPLEKLVPYCSHLIIKNGIMIAMKGHIADELEKAVKVLNKNNLFLKEKINFTLPKENSERTLLVFNKR